MVRSIDCGASAEDRHLYFFVHIMKTGGSAFRRRLINHFGEAAVYPARDIDGTDPVKLNLSIDYLRERLAARGDEIQVITGHFPLRTAELIDGRFTTLTLLRDPVERMLSYLRQQRESRRPAGCALDELYDALRGRGDDNMTKMLALTPSELRASLFTRAELSSNQLERAKEALAGIDAVGLQESFDDFCDKVATRFGWNLGEPEVVHASAPAEASDGLRARIAEDNPFDMELYEFAKEMLAARASESTDDGRRLQVDG